MRWELADANGCPVKCVRAVDTATHPEFQGKGIFRSLTLAAVEEARSRGIDLIFNTPNEKSAPGYFKMGWREVGWLRPLIRPRIGPTAKSSPNGPPDLAQVLPIAGPVLDLESPGDREFFGLRTPRTTAYYQWRFAGHPAARYGWVASEREPGGAVVRCGVRSGRTELTVSELTAGADCLRRIARKHHARYMAGVFGGGSPERRAALNAAMFPVPGVGLRLVANPLTELGVDIFDRTNWDLAMSDVELL